MQNSVCITAVSAVSPLGDNLEDIFAAITKAHSATGEIKSFDTTHYPSKVAAEARDSSGIIKSRNDQDRKELFIEQAFKHLFKEYASTMEKYEPKHRLVNLGSGIDYFDLVGYVNRDEESWQHYCKSASKTTQSLAKHYDIQGGAYTNVSACVASTQALGLSYRILKQDPDKLIISGGFDSMLSPLHYMGFYKLGAFSKSDNLQQACRPFDKNRSGLVLGEGAAIYALESEQNADKEQILAQIVGYGSSNDAYMVTDPQPSGEILARAVMEAIDEAGITADEIDCLHLHGTGTYKNGIAEANAMKIIFPEHYSEIPVYSMKGQIGHLIGACGAMEMLGVIYSLQKQKVPITVNYETPDPSVALNVIKDEELSMPIRYILKINSAFGGQNSALVVKRYE